MKYLMPILLAALMVILGSSCASQLSPLSLGMIDKFNWSDTQMKHIQYYLSSDIIIQRKLDDSRSEIDLGQIKIINGEKIEEIVFRESTPGVFVKSLGGDRIAVSFDENDNKFLVFGPNPKQNNKYTLLAKKWDEGRGGLVKYANKTYTATLESSRSQLLVDIKNLDQSSVTRRRAEGRKID